MQAGGVLVFATLVRVLNAKYSLLSFSSSKSVASERMQKLLLSVGSLSYWTSFALSPLDALCVTLLQNAIGCARIKRDVC
jgi:hypothetical protein